MHMAQADESNSDYEFLYHSCSSSLNNEDHCFYQHTIESVSSNGYLVSFTDGMTFTIDWWYRSAPKKWKKGDQIYIVFDSYYQKMKLEHSVLKDIAWGEMKSLPYNIDAIKSFLSDSNDAELFTKLTTNLGFVFKMNNKENFKRTDWSIGDYIVVLANSSTVYQLWNLNKNTIIVCEFIPQTNTKISLIFDDILTLESRLNAKIIQQPEATKAIATSLVIHQAGLKGKERPIGVFLFLGPTGVGKTELAKTLAKEIYKDPSKLLRFDMSHFVEYHTISRLMGSPPGYINHEEGGQLTEPLRENSQKIILLDEIEKANPLIHKLFLPVFDEGFIVDNNNNRIDCSDSIFIMTSNLYGPEIAELYRMGHKTEEILPLIEPALIEALSPELYNRVEPVLFQPLEKEAMGSLVDLMLNRLIDRIWKDRKIELTIDNHLKSFLIENGYHPILGARPLNKLIEKRVVATLAYNIVMNGIKSDSKITLSYDAQSDAVILCSQEIAEPKT